VFKSDALRDRVRSARLRISLEVLVQARNADASGVVQSTGKKGMRFILAS